MKDVIPAVLKDIPLYYIWMVSFSVTFLEAFVKSFQSRNIAQGRDWVAAGTSVAVTFTIFATVGLFVLAGWSVFIPAASGGAIGTFTSMRLHKRIFTWK